MLRGFTLLGFLLKPPLYSNMNKLPSIGQHFISYLIEKLTWEVESSIYCLIKLFKISFELNIFLLN